MSELLQNKDTSVNLLKCAIDATSDHVLRKNDVDTVINDDMVLELYLCSQDEFKDNVLAKAEVLYKDFVQDETTSGSFAISRHVVFYDINTRASVLKAHCDFRHTANLD